MLEQIINEIGQQSVWEWIALVSGVVYVLLAARNNFICWFFGILSCAIFVVISYAKYSLYADAALNFIYVLLGFQGLYFWWKGVQDKTSEIKSISTSKMMTHVLMGVLASLAIHYFLKEYTQAAATSIDSVTTVFSIIATLWLVYRYKESWFLFVLVDAVYVALYFSRGAYLFALLFVIYTVVALSAWLSWRKQV